MSAANKLPGRSWDKRWMEVCSTYAAWSKDPKRQVGAVIVNDRQVQVSAGWNGLPRGVADTPARYKGAVKDRYVEHAERNAIFNAAAEGIATRGCTIYTNYFPCSACARAIIQAGIKRVVSIKPDWDSPTRGEDWAIADAMLIEAGVEVHFHSCK